MPSKTYHLFSLGVLCLSMALSDARAQTDKGIADQLEETRARAEQGGKGLLLLFTGPAGDPASQRLHERILSNERFEMAVARHLLLLEIELPGEGDQNSRLDGFMADLVRDLGVNRLPSMHLVDAQLRPFGRIDYRGQDAGACLREITSKRAVLARRNKSFALAEKMGGEPKARELDLALILLGQDICVRRYRDVIDTLFALDEDGSYGIKRRYSMRLAWEELSWDVPQLLHDGLWQQVEDRVDAFMKQHEGSAINIWKQQALYWKATAIMQDEGLKSAEATLRKAKAAAPYSALGTRIGRMLKSMEAPLEDSPQASKYSRIR